MARQGLFRAVRGPADALVDIGAPSLDDKKASSGRYGDLYGRDFVLGTMSRAIDIGKPDFDVTHMATMRPRRVIQTLGDVAIKRIRRRERVAYANVNVQGSSSCVNQEQRASQVRRRSRRVRLTPRRFRMKQVSHSEMKFSRDPCSLAGVRTDRKLLY